MTAHSLAPARALVRRMLRHAGVTLRDVRAERVLMGSLAARCIGRRDAVVFADIGKMAYLRRIAAGWQIVVSRESQDLAFDVAHELGHWAILELAGLEMERAAEERLADDFAFVLLGRADASPMGAEERAVWDQRAGGA